jgi:hypothetical protein
MTQRERMTVARPALFGAFRERRTRGQARRARLDRVYTAVAWLQRRWRRR